MKTKKETKTKRNKTVCRFDKLVEYNIYILHTYTHVIIIIIILYGIHYINVTFFAQKAHFSFSSQRMVLICLWLDD
jgi:hypothetical protein